MPDKKFKTPNGQIVNESELSAKYGDRFNSLIQDKTFSEVTEPVYKTPNGKYATESTLKTKYGAKFDELSSNNTFVLDNPTEKKNSVATTAPPKLASATPTGSSDGKNSSGFPKIDMNGIAPGNGVQPNYTAGKEVKKVVTPETKYKEGTVAWNHQKMIENNPDYVSNYDKFKQVKNVSDAKKAEIAQDNEDEFNGVGIWNNVKSFGRQVVNTALQGAASLADIHPDDKKDIKIEEDPFADQKAKAKKEFQDKVLLARRNKETVPVFTIQDINQRAKEIKLQERIDSQSETQIKDFLQKDNETGGLQKNKFQSFEIGNYATIQEKDKVLLEQQNIERNVIKGLEGELKGLEVKLTENGLSPENLKLYKEKNNSLNTIKSEYEKADSDFKNSDQYKNYIKKSEELKPIDAKYKSINAELEKAKLDIEDAKKNKDSKKESELITIYNQKVKESNAVREQYNTIYDGIKDNSFIGNYNKNIEEIRSRYNNAYKEVSELSKTANKSNQVSVEYNNKYKKYQEVIAESIDTHNKYVSNRKNLGSATENLDIFKRDYGSLKSFIGNIDAVMGDLAGGVVGVVDYALEAKKNILGYQTGNDIYAQKIAQGVAVDLKTDSDKVRSEIMKPITVDNINNLSDLGDWFFQTAVAQQIPIFGLVATGGFGVGAIGFSSGGQRLNDMRGEMERGEKQYTDTELMVHPVGFAITETASAAVDLMILKNAARVISSATRPERQMIASGFAKRVMTVGGAVGKGGIYEGADEGLTKGGQNLIEGKPFMEGMVDPIAAGSVMGLLIPFGGHLFAEATKPFSTDTKIQEASAEILNLQKELDKPNLSTETRDLIKDNLAKTQVKVEALMKKQIGKIESLSKEQFQEILKNEKTQANIKQQAEGIQLDESISTDTKKQLLTNLKAEFKAQNERRMDLLARGASVQMERLDPAESIRLKDLAAKRLMKEQNPDGTKNITLEDEEISRTAIQIYNAEVKENNLRNERDKELADREKAKQIANELPTITEDYNIVDTPVVINNLSLEEKEKETREKIKRKDLFDNVGDFSSSLGGSDIAAVPVSHKEKNGIEFVEYAHPKTGSIDVVVTGVSDNDFVGYYRIYENGKPTDKWSSKFENKSRNKENFKTMIGGVQSMLPEGHQYTETTSISTDGLRVWEQQLSRGYELQTDSNGNIVTNEVAINGDAIVNELGIDVNQGNFDNISVTNNQQFQSVKKALLPYLQKFGLNESNIRNVNGTVEIDLPVLRKTKQSEQNVPAPIPGAQPQAEAEKVAQSEKVENILPTVPENYNIVDQEPKTTPPIEDAAAPSVEKEEYATIIKTKIGNLFDTAAKIKDKVVKEFIRPVTKEEVLIVKEKTGIDIDEEFEHTIDNSSINHTLKKHGNKQKESLQGQIAVEKKDFELVPDIIDNYDTIEKGELNEKGLETIVYTKTYPDGTTYVVEEVRTGKKELALNTMYKRKKSGGFMPTENSILPLTSETTPDTTKIQNNTGNEATPTTNTPTDGNYEKGSVVSWGGKERTIKSTVKIGNELKYEIDLGNGKSIWTNKAVLESENAGKENGDTVADGNVRPTNDNVGEGGTAEPKSPIQESVSKPVDGGEVKGGAEVGKKYKLTKNGQAFEVKKNNGKFEVTNSKGEKVSRTTERAVLRKHAENFDFTQGEKAIDRSDFAAHPDAYNSEIAKKSNNAAEIAETIIYEQSVDKKGGIIAPTLDHKEAIIADGINKIKGDGFIRFDDRNNITPQIKKSYFDKEGRQIDDLAKELSEMAGVEITEEDIADFIKKHPKGVKEFYDNVKKEAKNTGILESNDIFDLKKKFEDITGLPANNEFLNKAIEQQNRKSELNSILDNLTDAELQQKHLEIEQFNTEQNGGKEINQDAKGDIEIENNKGSEQKPEIQGVNPKPTTKEKIAERIKLSDAKVDDWKNAVNGIDSIFGIKIKIDDVEGLNKNGIDIVEMIANIAKQAIAAGIHIDEAINKTIEYLKETIDFDVNIDDIKERINPKKEADNDFTSKSGKKSLLGRLIEGGNPDVITKAVKELGENYDVRNQEDANTEAISFIDKVGASEALKAIKDGLITNSDVKMLIYDEALTRLKTEISDEMNNNPEDREALIKKFQEVSDDFDKAIRDAGQGIAIMNYIYNKNQTLKYNLKKQIADWKRNDPNGEIPADVKAKFEELEQKLKDVEERTKGAEERAKKAEDALAIKNVQEDVERKNQEAKKNKSGLTPQEQNRKKQLRDKFARANDVSGIPALLVDPEFREYLGLVLKTAKGDFTNFSNEILKELGKSARQHLPDLFANAGGKGAVKVTDLQSITIDKKGKIKIPAQMLRDYVEAGETDIDAIAQLIKDDIADEFPDADLRDIRDALTGYGKQINPNKDEITAQVNKLKEYGRLLSAYDDVMNGQMPLKSGLTRPKSEQKARELRRNINRLAKELNLEQVDTEKQWANAIDKVKTQLKNQIEDLDKQIANGEKRKIDRTPIRLDEEATALKSIRDAKKQILDDLVGKPELTEEQKIANAEKSLETSIKKIQEEIDTNDIAFKEKPTAVTSEKIQALKAIKKALLESKKQLRQEAGLIEQQRLKTTKTRIKNQIEDLNNRIKNKDFAKKEIKPILADSELNALRAEKEAIYEEYEKMKYLQELKNRTLAKKIMDEGMEALGLARAIKASLDLGLIGIQLRGFTYSELLRNPKELGRKFVKLFGAIGSQNKTNKAMSELIGHPLHSLAKKLDIGMTHPDLRNEVREEMASGNLLHFIWSSPVLAAEALGAKPFMNSKRSSIGDTFINSVKTQYNKLFKNYQLEIKQKDKFSIKEQWKNINAFEAVERGLSTYGNQLRFEEFVRGVERLKAEGKDEINHLEDYKLLASYIRTFSGRAKPAGFELNQKALNVFFFSFKNMASVVQQLNPIYYGLQHIKSTDFKNGNYFKPSVANKMAMATMFKSVASTSATILFVMAAYNAFKDDDEEEATIEKDPRSSDFGKIKIGNFRYDPWGGYIPLISLYARLATEEVKKSDGTVVKFGEGFGGIQSRGDAATKFLINKESPGFQMFHKYMTSTEEVDKATGETYRTTPFGGKLSEEDAYSFYPIFLGSVKQAKEKDYEGVQAFLTAYSVLGLGNVQEYENKKDNPEDEFLKSQAKKKAQFELPNSEKDKIRVDDKLSRAEGTIKMIEEMKIAKAKGLPYYISKDAHLTKEQIQNFDFSSKEENIKRAKKIIAKTKLKYGITE